MDGKERRTRKVMPEFVRLIFIQEKNKNIHKKKTHNSTGEKIFVKNFCEQASPFLPFVALIQALGKKKKRYIPKLKCFIFPVTGPAPIPQCSLIYFFYFCRRIFTVLPITLADGYIIIIIIII